MLFYHEHNACYIKLLMYTFLPQFGIVNILWKVLALMKVSRRYGYYDLQSTFELTVNAMLSC